MKRSSSIKRTLLARGSLVAAAVLSVPVAWAQLPPPPVSPAPVVRLEYDAQGNPTKTILAPNVLNHTTSSTYDSLHRRKDSTDARSKTTLLEYNGREDLTKVTDPRGLVTRYDRNGLGDVSPLISPDTGTADSTYDAAGNLKTRLDARSPRVLATYSYDPLNRPNSVVYSVGQNNQTITWEYDEQGPGFSNGIGRLTSTTFSAAVVGYTYDANNLRLSTQYATGTSKIAYDPQGRATSISQMVPTGGGFGPFTLAVGYSYDAAGNITAITYPSGRRLNIVHTAGQPSSMTLAKDTNSSPQTLLSLIEHEPFGGPKKWQWHMSSGVQEYERLRDGYGRLVRYRMGNVIRDLTYNEADRITRFTHYDATTTAPTTTLDQEFTYDEVGRPIGVTVGGVSRTIGYDDNGNRIIDNVGGNVSFYTIPTTSNRVTGISNPSRAFSHDGAGNTLTDNGAPTGFTAKYDLSNRLAEVGSSRTRSNISFIHDAFGRRVAKMPTPLYNCDWSIDLQTGQPIQVCSIISATPGVLFAYDQQGQLLGEYSAATGLAIREYIWLGSTPIAMFEPGATAQDPPLVYYFHTDHLDTPRAVVDPAGNLRWRWLSEPFGTTEPETNPQGFGPFTQNLRMPGQYADAETGLFYNYFRDYDPSIGRYTQSDPIGLAGGINTYGYVGGNPLSNADPKGLECTSANGSTTCQFPGGPRFTVRTPQGFPSYLGPKSRWYHAYDYRRPIRCADPGDVMNNTRNTPTPGRNARGAMPRGRDWNDAGVRGYPFDNRVTSYWTQDLNTGAYVVVNMAGSGDGSAFGPGYVVRFLANGELHTAGEGANWQQWPFPDLQDEIGDAVWGSQMEDIISRSKRNLACECPR